MNASSKSSPRADYDEWYRQGDAHWEDAPGKSVLVAALERCCSAQRSLRLLDIGCGTGSFLARIASEVSLDWRLYGVDSSSEAIAAGSSKYPHLNLTCADAAQLERPESIDVVTCYGSWEHFEKPADAIAAAARVLVPGGWVFAMIPALGVHRTDRTDEGWYEDTEVEGSDRRQMQWNLRRETWARHFSEAGLLLFDSALATSCGAKKPGVFFFGVRGEAGSLGKTSIGSGFHDLASLAKRLTGLEPAIERVVALLTSCLKNGGKILVCGNGGSAGDAQHFVAELVGRLRLERKAYAAVALSTDPSVVTAVANDFGYQKVFERQVEALGRPGDVLIGISTSGTSANVVDALERGRALGLDTVMLHGERTNDSIEKCTQRISVPARDTQRVQEGHIAVLHAIAGAVEDRLTSGKADSTVE